MNNRVDFDNYIENYNQLLNDNTKLFSSNEEYFARYKVDVIRRRTRTSVRRLLEYGCGIGRNITFLQQAFPDALIMGSDISTASLEFARNKNPHVQFIHEKETPPSIGGFDLILVAGVYHHVPITQRQQITKILFTRLAPGGLLFVFEHNPYNPVTRHIVNTCPYDRDAILLRPSEMKQYLQKSGFYVEHSSYCLFVPPRFSRLTFLEKKMGWLPLGGQFWIQAKRPK